MALNSRTVQFLIDRLVDANQNSLVGVASQIFEHLQQEVKDNPAHDKYQNELEKWTDWFNQVIDLDMGDMPRTFEEAKSLSYAMYKKDFRDAGRN